MKSPVKGWTEAKFRSFITSLLRSGMRRFPNKSIALTQAKTTKKKNKKTNRMAQHYRCAKCKKEFPLSEVQVDHISPVTSTQDGWISWDVFIERLFCSVDNLQVLCKNVCHKIKTSEENKQRKKK